MDLIGYTPELWRLLGAWLGGPAARVGCMPRATCCAPISS